MIINIFLFIFAKIVNLPELVQFSYPVYIVQTYRFEKFNEICRNACFLNRVKLIKLMVMWKSLMIIYHLSIRPPYKIDRLSLSWSGKRSSLLTCIYEFLISLPGPYLGLCSVFGSSVTSPCDLSSSGHWWTWIRLSMKRVCGSLFWLNKTCLIDNVPRWEWRWKTFFNTSVFIKYAYSEINNKKVTSPTKSSDFNTK